MVQVIRTFCDAHDDEHAGTTYNVVLSQLADGRWSRLLEHSVIDLCDDARAELLEAVEEVLRRHGRFDDVPSASASSSTTGPNGRRFYCEVCGRSYSARGTLRNHLRDVHGLPHPVEDRSKQRPAPVPSEGGRYPCDVEGCDFVGTRPQGLGSHKFRTHGIRGVTRPD